MKRLMLVCLVGLLAAPIGCRQQAAGDPVTQIAPSTDARLDSLKTVAFLGISSNASREAIQTFERLIEQQMTSGGQKFTIMGLAEVDRRAQSESESGLIDEVRGFWQRSAKVDPLRLPALCQALGVDGILVGTIDEWTEAAAARGSEQSPYTRVTASLEIYSGKDGKRVWSERSSKTEEEEAMPIMADDDHEQNIRRRERQRSQTIRSTQKDQSAPPIESVAQEVVAALTQALMR